MTGRIEKSVYYRIAVEPVKLSLAFGIGYNQPWRSSNQMDGPDDFCSMRCIDQSIYEQDHFEKGINRCVFF